MGLLSNKLIDKESLKPGDHIYSWRTAYIYAHHGIYIGDDKVIHFTISEENVGSGSRPLIVFSGLSSTQVRCPTCTPPLKDGVVMSCLNCFLSGGVLCRYEYGVSLGLFVIARGGTCTREPSDAPEVVVYRAKYLLENGFGCHNIFKNNCEDFAFYCKTGLVFLNPLGIGLGGQVSSIIGWLVPAPVGLALRVAAGTDAVKVSPEDLKKFLE